MVNSQHYSKFLLTPPFYNAQRVYYNFYNVNTVIIVFDRTYIWLMYNYILTVYRLSVVIIQKCHRYYFECNFVIMNSLYYTLLSDAIYAEIYHLIYQCYSLIAVFNWSSINTLKYPASVELNIYIRCDNYYLTRYTYQCIIYCLTP